MTPVRILIADDHAMFRDALRKLLQFEPDFEVVGESGNIRETLSQIEKLHPDVLLLDLNMPRTSGMDVLRRLDGTNPAVHVILLVASIEPSQVIEALRLGACGVVMKDSASRLLYKSIRAVLAGEYWVGRASIANLINVIRGNAMPVRQAVKSGARDLTRRESEILSLVVDGCTNKDIAEKLVISEQTVKHHLTHIFEKMGVANRLELALSALGNDLVSQP